MKKVVSILFFVLFMVMMSACSADYDMGYVDEDSSDSNEVRLATGDLPDRKIIYDVDIDIDVEQLTEASDTLKTMIESDEWFDQEYISTHSHQYTIRIKTSRLDDFINDLKDEFDVRNYSKVGTDITVEYQDATNQILALEAQMERLLELYEDASISDMILINEQISNIEIELQSLNRTINSFDSLVEYSKVELSFYGESDTNRPPFLTRVANGFLSGIDAFIYVIDGLIVLIATIFPFVVVIGAVSGGVVIYIKKRNTKLLKDDKKQPKA